MGFGDGGKFLEIFQRNDKKVKMLEILKNVRNIKKLKN